MKLKVNQDVCVGCGACQAICPEVFEINDDGYANVYVEQVDEDFEESAIDAKEGCPVYAISEVTDSEENDGHTNIHVEQVDKNSEEPTINTKEERPVYAISEEEKE